MNTQTWYTKGISINSNDILSSFPLHYLIKPFCKLVFLKIFFFWFSKLRVSSHGQIKFVCQTSLNMYVLALCTTTPFFFPEQLSVMYGHMMPHSRAVCSPAFHPWELISPGEWSWPRCKCRWACGQCQQKIKTFAPSGSNMRAYFSTYSCFSFWYFFCGMKIYLKIVFCFSSICCQSPSGCSSSEVTLTLTKKSRLLLTHLHANGLMLLLWDVN